MLFMAFLLKSSFFGSRCINSQQEIPPSGIPRVVGKLAKAWPRGLLKSVVLTAGIEKKAIQQPADGIMWLIYYEILILHSRSYNSKQIPHSYNKSLTACFLRSHQNLHIARHTGSLANMRALTAAAPPIIRPSFNECNEGNATIIQIHIQPNPIPCGSFSLLYKFALKTET
jgi:hypothetical protein